MDLSVTCLRSGIGGSTRCAADCGIGVGAQQRMHALTVTFVCGYYQGCSTLRVHGIHFTFAKRE